MLKEINKNYNYDGSRPRFVKTAATASINNGCSNGKNCIVKEGGLIYMDSNLKVT
jgi:hypothetical protein